MIPHPADFFPLFAQDQSHREAVAGAERFRSRRSSVESAAPRPARPVRRPHPARAG